MPGQWCYCPHFFLAPSQPPAASGVFKGLGLEGVDDFCPDMPKGQNAPQICRLTGAQRRADFPPL